VFKGCEVQGNSRSANVFGRMEMSVIVGGDKTSQKLNTKICLLPLEAEWKYEEEEEEEGCKATFRQQINTFQVEIILRIIQEDLILLIQYRYLNINLLRPWLQNEKRIETKIEYVLEKHSRFIFQTSVLTQKCHPTS
jgi:hypothetical protein